MSRRTLRQLGDVPIGDWSEGEWRDWVIDRAKRDGWHVIEFRRAVVKGSWLTPTSQPVPDLMMVRGDELVFLELKAEHGRWSSPEQADIVARLQGVETVECWAVRPSDVEAVRDLLAAPVPR